VFNDLLRVWGITFVFSVCIFVLDPFVTSSGFLVSVLIHRPFLVFVYS
jgi:hypothetical protein